MSFSSHEARINQARVDADSDPNLDTSIAANGVGDIAQALLHGESGGDSFLGMGPIAGSPKNRHDTIADVFINVAAASFNFAGQQLKNIIDEFVDLFRVETLRDAGKIANIAEYDGYDPPSADERTFNFFWHDGLLNQSRTSVENRGLFSVLSVPVNPFWPMNPFDLQTRFGRRIRFDP